MTSTGTYDFNPASSALTFSAYGRIGIRRTAVTMEHLADAAVEFNLLQVEISNHQPNLWRTELFPIALIAGTATYNLPVRMIAIQDIYMTVSDGGVSSDRVLGPLSLFEYDAQALKTDQAPPTSYLINKTMVPTITFYPVPDNSATYTVNVRLLSQPQDVSLKNGTTLDLPYKYLDAAVAGLAHRLSRYYAPDKEVLRKQDFADALSAAQNTDTQDSVNMYVAPDFSGYYR